MLKSRASFFEMFILQQCLEHALARGEMKKFFPRMNNSFRGIQSYQGDKIIEHMQVSLLLGRKTKKLCSPFPPTFAGFERAFSKKSPLST